MIKVAIVFGTRPEVIKLACLAKAFEKEKDVSLNICFTGQHKEMVLPLLDFFDIKIDSSLDLMQPSQTLSSLSSMAIASLDVYFKKVQPDIVFVQGDTTTAMCAAMAAFYNRIKIAHIEAGLRTFDIYSPFPEEFNRKVISAIANLHFAPTRSAAQNLLNENIAPDKVIVTGNTVIDALLFTKNKIEGNTLPLLQQYNWYTSNRPIILITGHRRENFGDGFENICHAIKELAIKYPSHNFVYPVHLNPNVQEPVHKTLSNISNVYLIMPLGYVEFVSLMNKCCFILTDSGGVQEEAPTFGKPVLVMRTSTEREEALASGVARLVGTDKKKIIDSVSELIDDTSVYKAMATANNPFGDGNASQKIIKKTLAYFQ